MIAIIDYGVGNIQAFANIYKKAGVNIVIAKKRDDLIHATKLILPGVGHFDYAMQRFNQSGMRETVDEMVLMHKTPVLGICVGMQMLAKNSEEGRMKGLSWINANVRKFDISKLTQSTRLPHMGWNDIKAVAPSPLLDNLGNLARFYFLHSYYFECETSQNTIAVSNYGIEFTCIVSHENIYGVQFHPEKSHHFGTQLLNNFANL